MAFWHWISAMAIALLVSGCGQRVAPAPVEEIAWRPWSVHQKTYMVRRGDTLYSIAFRYEKDYLAIARRNGLPPPYSLKAGQILRLDVPQRRVYQPAPATPARVWYPHNRKPVASAPAPKPVVRGGTGTWIWPAHGRVVSGFSPQAGRKGIDIAGKKGDRIIASSSGVVAYAGSGLAGYGNLVIIRHNNQFLTAYANNARNLVREGQQVRAGQAIAEMGLIDRRYWGVHFEIRRFGQPVNPMGYLRNSG